MAKTNAERQRDYRRRKGEERAAEREAVRRGQVSAIAARFETAFRALEAERDAAMAENERLRGELAALCPAHAAAVDRCPRCGARR